MNHEDNEFIDEHDQESVRTDNRTKSHTQNSVRSQRLKVGNMRNKSARQKKHLPLPNQDLDQDGFSDDDLEIAERDNPRRSYKTVLKNTKDIGKRGVQFVMRKSVQRDEYEKSLQDSIGHDVAKELSSDESDDVMGKTVEKDFIRNHFILLMLSIIVSTIIIIIVATAGPEKKGNTSSTDIFVEAPPSNLEDLCDISNISTEKGHKQCVTACESSQCCMKAGDESCFLQNEDVCGLYWPCGTLYNTIDGGPSEDNSYSYEDSGSGYLPPPPNDLDSICSDASLSTEAGYIACNSACHSGQCCFDKYTKDESYGIQSCRESHTRQCSAYLSCSLLDDFIDEHGSNIDIVNRKCSQSNVMKGINEKNDCESICQSRSCCFFGSSDLNCYAENKEWCDEYEACQILVQLDTDKFELGPDNMKETCTDANKLTDEVMQTCLNSCNQAKCCFFDDMDCGHVDCTEFDYCQTVLGESNFLSNKGTSPENPTEGTPQFMQYKEGSPADLACSEIVTDHGKENCLFVCKDARCCFDQTETGCQNNKSCKHFQSCLKVLPFLN